jgi:hypothetical protein
LLALALSLLFLHVDLDHANVAIAPAHAKGAAGAEGSKDGGDGGGNGGASASAAGVFSGPVPGKGLGHERREGASGRGSIGVASADDESVARRGHDHGTVASALRRLAAACPPASARANAVPNSALGLIASYEAAVRLGIALAEEAGALSEQIAALEVELEAAGAELGDRRAVANGAAELAAQEAAMATAHAEVLSEAAEQARSAADLARQKVDEVEARLARIASTLEAKRERAVEVDDDLAEAAEDEVQALSAAANKPVTDEILSALDDLLEVAR